MKKAIIFDLDGLLIDSERLTFIKAKQVAKEDYNKDLTEDMYVNFIGKTKEGVNDLIEDYFGKGFPFYELHDKYYKLVHQSMKEDGVPVKEGVYELLDYLKENGYKMMIATSSRSNRVDDIMKWAHFDDYMDAYICGDEVENGKPNPEVFLKSLDKLQVNCDEAYVIEDSESGIMASHNANIEVVCVPDMKYPEPDFEQLCYCIKDSLKDVLVAFKEGKL